MRDGRARFTRVTLRFGARMGRAGAGATRLAATERIAPLSAPEVARVTQQPRHRSPLFAGHGSAHTEDRAPAFAPAPRSAHQDRAGSRATLWSSVTIASRRIRPSHRGHASTSKPKVRFKSSAHGRYGARRGTSATSSTHGAGAADARFGPRRARSLLAEPSTHAYRTVSKRGGGTEAQRRLSSESGSRSTATVPSEKAFLRPMRTSPSGPHVTRSCATAGRRMYLSSASRPSLSKPPSPAAPRLRPSESLAAAPRRP